MLVGFHLSSSWISLNGIQKSAGKIKGTVTALLSVSILFLETYGEIRSPNPEVGNDVVLGLDAPVQSDDVQLFQTPVTATCGVGWGLLQLYKRLV